jgi:hypothetical protein
MNKDENHHCSYANKKPISRQLQNANEWHTTGQKQSQHIVLPSLWTENEEKRGEPREEGIIRLNNGNTLNMMYARGIAFFDLPNWSAGSLTFQLSRIFRTEASQQSTVWSGAVSRIFTRVYFIMTQSELDATDFYAINTWLCKPISALRMYLLAFTNAYAQMASRSTSQTCRWSAGEYCATYDSFQIGWFLTRPS